MARPRKYTEVEALQAQIDKYFEECDKQNKPYTICGLARACDLTRQSLLNYTEKPEFFDTIKKAKAKCEEYLEEQLYFGKNAAGVIFGLKNNYGWTDKTEQELKVKGGLDIQKIYIDKETKQEANKHIDDFINDD